jgi:hypothetical protein
MTWSESSDRRRRDWAAVAVPVVLVAERGRRQQIPVSASAARGGTHPHASTGPDGSTGARTGTVGGQRLGNGDDQGEDD